MANKFANARRSLSQAKEAAEIRLRDIEIERREIKESMKSLDAALKALDRPDRKRSSQTNGTAREQKPNN